MQLLSSNSSDMASHIVTRLPQLSLMLILNLMSALVRVAPLSATQIEATRKEQENTFPELIHPGLLSNTKVQVAQITPDNSLRSERSIIVPGEGDRVRVNGGATRGANLFHSFKDFNVSTGQKVYFTNPAGIENILSRVTGSNISTIDGLLGVDGAANLFFLNSNGVIFKPNARLDIGGSFMVSAGKSLTFEDGSKFSTQQTENDLLTMSVPLGVQFNEPLQGDISNAGILRVAQDLTLSGNHLYLEGQIVAGEDVTLQARNTLTIRDSATEVFGVKAYRDLTIQGHQLVDIFALKHPDSGLYSGGNLLLRSNNPVIGDAHFYSRGNWAVETLKGQAGSLLSPNNPIIIANGNVNLGDYTGASLHILAGGSVKLGNVTINSPGSVDSTINPSNEASLNRSRSISDLATLYLTKSQAKFNPDGSLRTIKSVLLPTNINGSQTATLDVRAGIDWASLGGIPSAFVTTSNDFGLQPFLVTINSPTRADIRLNGDIKITEPGGLVLLTNQFSPNHLKGTISASGINIMTSSNMPSEHGGDILIHSRGNLDIKDSNFDSTAGDKGDGGAIVLSSISGDILIKNSLLDSFSYSSSDDSGKGGTIAFNTSSGDISVNNSLLSSSSLSDSGDTGDGGELAFSTISGDISIKNSDLFNDSSSYSGDAGDGGVVTVSTRSGDISLYGSTLSSYSASDLRDAGDGKEIAVSTHSGDISINSSSLFTYSESYSGDTGNGGAITFNSSSGDISLNNSILSSYTESYSGNTGDGGAITFNSSSGDISLNNSILSSYTESYSGNTGDGGAISLSSTSGDISFISPFPSLPIDSSSSSVSRDTGDGGAITLSSTSGDISLINSDAFNSSSSYLGDTGDGGAISLSTRSGNILLTNSSMVSSSSSSFGDSGKGGAISLSTHSGNISLLVKSSFLSSSLSTSSFSSFSDSGEGGAITLSSRSGDILLSENSSLSSSSFSSRADAGDAGAIIINAPKGSILGSNTTLNSSSFSFSTKDENRGGNINLQAGDMISGLDLETSSTEGISGDTEIRGTKDLLIKDIDISTSAQLEIRNLRTQEIIRIDKTNLGQSGRTVIHSQGNILFNNVKIFSNSNGNFDAGDIIIKSPKQIRLIGSKIDSNANSFGNGGNITFNSPSIILDDKSSISALTNSTGHGGNITFNSPNDRLRIMGEGLFSVETNGDDSQTGDAGNAGSFIIDAPNLAIDSARLIASTRGDGEGGNIFLRNATALNLDNVQLQTSSEGGSGFAGNIILEDLGVVLMRRASLIQAGASDTGSGGNVDIEADFVITFPDEDNDILATAELGTGGNITITANSIIGFREVKQFSNKLRGNDHNDISATSRANAQGSVNLNTTEVDPNDNAPPLPASFNPPLIQNTCQPSANNSFVYIKSGGGVPNFEIKSIPIWAEIRSNISHEFSNNTLSKPILSHPQKLIAEAQGWIKNPDDSIQLIVPNFSPLTIALQSNSCKKNTSPNPITRDRTHSKIPTTMRAKEATTTTEQD